MVLPECRDQLDLLMRYYGWLTEDYEFAVIDMASGRMGSCSFILQQGDCRVFISVDRGQLDFPQVALVPAANKLDAWATNLQWYHVVDLVDYLRGEYASWPQIEERLQFEKDLSADEILRRGITHIQSFWPQVMILFQEDEFRSQQGALDEFLKIKRTNQDRQRKEWMRRQAKPP